MAQALRGWVDWCLKSTERCLFWLKSYNKEGLFLKLSWCCVENHLGILENIGSLNKATFITVSFYHYYSFLFLACGLQIHRKFQEVALLLLLLVMELIGICSDKSRKESPQSISKRCYKWHHREMKLRRCHRQQLKPFQWTNRYYKVFVFQS